MNKPSHWFNEETHKLGEVCPSKHYWGTSSFTLRVRATGECPKCRMTRKKEPILRASRKPKASYRSREEWIELFMENVVKTEGCWHWRGHTVGDYGYFNYEGASTTVQRVAYILLLRRRVSPGEYIKRECGDTLCVNPEHLYKINSPNFEWNEQQRRAAKSRRLHSTRNNT